MEVVIDTVENGWVSVLSRFRQARLIRVASRHGVSFDLPGLTVRLRDPTHLAIPSFYPYPQFVGDDFNRLFGNQREVSLFYHRLREWVGSQGEQVDQLSITIDHLKRSHDTRSAVFSTWQPVDVGAEFPVSPVAGSFRILHSRLYLFLTSRSVDLWTGFVPELLTFSRLLLDAAVEVGVNPGQIVHHAWSAHVYESDFLSFLGDL